MSGRRCFLKVLLELSAYLSTRYSNYSLENFLVKRASRLRKKQQKHLTQRIAVFGASFNPTTLGHVDFIRCLLQSSVPSFERICLIPSGQSPLKTAAEYASAKDRLQILDLVLQTQFTSLERARLRVETTEVSRQSPSWMVMTLTSLILSHRAQESYTLACGYDHLLQMRTVFLSAYSGRHLELHCGRSLCCFVPSKDKCNRHIHPYGTKRRIFYPMCTG